MAIKVIEEMSQGLLCFQLEPIFLQEQTQVCDGKEWK